MAKRELFDLTDEEFACFIDNLHRQMRKEQLPYVLVGGCALQAHVLKRLHEQTGKTLSEIAADPAIRVQDYLRATDDVDLAVDSKIQGELGDIGFGKKVFSLLDGLAVEEFISPSEEFIFGYELRRQGIKRPVFQVYVDGETNDDRVISLNIGRKRTDLTNLDAENYDLFVRQGQEVELPYSPGFTIRTRVIRPEHLLASKISKFRVKDTFDIHSLADLMVKSGEKPDLEEIKRLVTPEYEENYYRFLSVAKLEDSSAP